MLKAVDKDKYFTYTHSGDDREILLLVVAPEQFTKSNMHLIRSRFVYTTEEAMGNCNVF